MGATKIAKLRTFVSHSWGEAFEDFALTLHRLLDEEVLSEVPMICLVRLNSYFPATRVQ